MSKRKLKYILLEDFWQWKQYAFQMIKLKTKKIDWRWGGSRERDKLEGCFQNPKRRAAGACEELKSEARKLSGTWAKEIRVSPGRRGWKEVLTSLSSV